MNKRNDSKRAVMKKENFLTNLTNFTYVLGVLVLAAPLLSVLLVGGLNIAYVLVSGKALLDTYEQIMDASDFVELFVAAGLCVYRFRPREGVDLAGIFR